MQWQEWVEALGIEVVWLETLARGTRGYYRPLDRTIFLNPACWRGRPESELASFVVHEIGHELTGSAYYRNQEPQGIERDVLESKATRRGAGQYISDADVLAARADGCTELWEFAERWGVDGDTAARRLEHFRQWGEDYADTP